ncbi:MAG: AMP-binding protein, partial [Rhodospirillaceae bacterium]|nr:AMP-binding protein [Rhodospirillaceae bacterium]
MAKAIKSYLHRGGDEPLLGATIPEHFDAIARKYADREAVACLHQNRRLTYDVFRVEIDRVARGLVGLGLSRGDRVGVWSTDNVEWLLLQMATARIGAVLVNINPANRPRELAHALTRAEVQCLFTIPAFRHSDYVAMLTELLPELKTGGLEIENATFPHLKRVVLYDPTAPERTEPPHPGFTPWRDLLASSERCSTEELDAVTAGLDADDPINIQYTSGTTGFPKAVVLTHHNILNNAWFTARAMRFTEEDRLCVPVPFYHCFGMVLSNLLCFSVGACLVVPAEHFDPLAILQAVAAERCTALHGVPTMFIAELDHPEFKSFDMSSLRTGIMAGAPCPPELMKRVIEDMHCSEILIGYGQTEASPITHLTVADDSFERRIETVGRNLPHQEVKVADLKTGAAIPVGEIGEPCFRGYHVMLGYYNDDDATRNTIDAAGWLHSGDLGTMDEDGYLRITGRLKEMIIRGGENIYPAEIKAYLFANPKIS